MVLSEVNKRLSQRGKGRRIIGWLEEIHHLTEVRQEMMRTILFVCSIMQSIIS